VILLQIGNSKQRHVGFKKFGIKITKAEIC